MHAAHAGPARRRVNEVMATPRFALVVGVLLAVFPAATRGGERAVYYVDAEASGSGSGSNWVDAFPTLYAALQVATAGSEIRVAQGTYYPGPPACSRELTFQLISGVAVQGGYAGHGAADPDHRDPVLQPTILSGDIGEAGYCADDVYHVVTGTGTGRSAVLDGFVIESGQADGSFPHDKGGGMLNDPGGPTVRSCVFRDNFAQSGGAMYNGYGYVPLVENCTFVGNRAYSNGGAVFNMGSGADVRGCLFSDNSSELSGGAVSDLYAPSSYADCMFEGNVSVYRGGAVFNLTGAPTFTRCTFQANDAVGTGSSAKGGAGVYNDSGSPSFTDCDFLDNLSTRQGGGLVNRRGSPSLRNCRFAENLATGEGGGVYNIEGSPQLVNCAFVGNWSLVQGGALLSDGGTVTLLNSTLTGNRGFGTGAGGVQVTQGGLNLRSGILWGNRNAQGTAEAAQIGLTFGTLSVNYSCVQGWSGAWGGTGNIGAVPGFEDLAGPDGITGTEDDDLTLRVDSPCLDAGDPTYVPGSGETDLYGAPRLVCGTVDMGAVEFGRIIGDLTCDHVITIADFSAWSGCASDPARAPCVGECCVYDFSADGAINLRDFAAFQNAITAGEP